MRLFSSCLHVLFYFIHTAYDMYLIVDLVFSHLGFLDWEFFSDCVISWSLPTFTFSCDGKDIILSAEYIFLSVV